MHELCMSYARVLWHGVKELIGHFDWWCHKLRSVFSHLIPMGGRVSWECRTYLDIDLLPEQHDRSISGGGLCCLCSPYLFLFGFSVQKSGRIDFLRGLFWTLWTESQLLSPFGLVSIPALSSCAGITDRLRRSDLIPLIKRTSRGLLRSVFAVFAIAS